MRRRLITALAGLTALLGVGAAPPPLDLGVSVHFGQGWPDSLRATLADSGARRVREAIGWKRVETRRGAYSFTEATVGHIDRLCRDGYRVTLVTLLANPLYDGGRTVYTSVGRNALARFLAATAARYADCLDAIEIGNEVNIRANIIGVAALNRPASYVAILQAVYPAIKAAAPNVAVLGGSANSIATGFEIELANAGMLDVVDGVAIHPYRQDAANLDWELSRLAGQLAARGPARPLWLTEFSKDFAAGEDSAGFLLRMVTLMSSVGIAHADWYALVDQPAFPTMGLYTATGADKPAGEAFRYLKAEVLPRGSAVRQGDDPTLFHFRLGTDRQIVWGTPRTIHYSGAATARDARGRPIPLPDSIGDTPVVIEGEVTLSFGPPTIIADSLYGYGRAPWSYHARRGRQPELALAPVDWNWTSFIGHATLRPAAINQLGIFPVGYRDSTSLISRWTAAEAGEVFALACLKRRTIIGDGGNLQILKNGTLLQQLAAADDAPAQAVVPVAVAPGDRIDFAVLPGFDARGDSFGYRFQIARSRTDAPTC